MGIGSKSQLHWKALPDYSHPELVAWIADRPDPSKVRNR